MTSCDQTAPGETRGEGSPRDANGERAPGGSMRVVTKIFALVGFCLALLAVVSGVTIWQINKISVEIGGIVERDIPLTGQLTEITIHQLEQAINFERAFRAGEVMREHTGSKKIYEKAVRIFEGLTER
ncbi:MAG: hypothetical protein IIB62_08010, partial [Proteobacteria bacterium]|nr:hypothetical protein [Pseudomonadota bacterium]